MSLDLREILERGSEIPESPIEEEISSKLDETRERENDALIRLHARPNISQFLEILTQIEECRGVRAEAQKLQEEKVAVVRHTVQAQEAWLSRIDEAINSLK